MKSHQFITVLGTSLLGLGTILLGLESLALRTNLHVLKSLALRTTRLSHASCSKAKDLRIWRVVLKAKDSRPRRVVSRPMRIVPRPTRVALKAKDLRTCSQA